MTRHRLIVTFNAKTEAEAVQTFWALSVPLINGLARAPVDVKITYESEDDPPPDRHLNVVPNQSA